MARLSRISRYTARLHLPAAALDGLVLGVFTLNDIILRKSFGAGAVLITLLVMAQPVSQLLAIVWGTVMEGRDKRRFILAFGGIGRLLLVPIVFAGSQVLFFGPIVLSMALATAIVPALNALCQTNYPDRERGRVYGWVMSVTAITTMLGAIVAGHWMDVNRQAFRVAYPLAGLLGAGSAYLYFRIRPRRAGGRQPSTRALAAAASARAPLLGFASGWLGDVHRALRNPLKGSVATFRSDPDFFRFEVAFMVYGIAWMMMQPVIPIFLVDQIGVQYGQAALARGPIFWGMIALLSPWLGRLLDRWNAMRLAGLGFAVLALFPLGMALSHSVSAVFAAFAVYGAGMTAAGIGWQMGPIYFAQDRDAARYMGVHVTMVGIRGLVGMPLGLALLSTIGARATFVAASVLFATGSVLMVRLARRCEAARVPALAG